MSNENVNWAGERIDEHEKFYKKLENKKDPIRNEEFSNEKTHS